jgi:hypothetical protein
VRPRVARRESLGLSRAEFAVLRRLGTPQKIQDFLNALPANFEMDGQTCLSVREVLRQRRAHCIEGAMLAACALWIQGEPPLLMDMRAERDYDHVVALFRRGRFWGAISKTNPAVLRWRDPVYRSLRELAMSYLHEYANRRNQKTLRSYSQPFDLRRFDPELWVTNRKNCWDIGATLDEAPHTALLTTRQARLLRLRDAMERKADALVEHRRPRKR